MQTQVEIKNQGIKFNSPYDNAQIATRFRILYGEGKINGNFAQSLYQGAQRFKGYTARQLPWLHVLVAQAEDRPTKPEPTKIGGYKLVHEHMTNCRNNRENGGKGLKNPIIHLTVGETTVVLKLAGERSRNKGKVSVTSSPYFGEGVFFGWIDENGEFDCRVKDDAMAAILDRVAIDPAATISQIGRESGRCCYCNAELTTVPSKIAGCGKRCSENYRVYYPTAIQVREFVVDYPFVLEGSSDRGKWSV